MKNSRRVFLGIIIALAFIGLLLGSFFLSLAEGKIAPTLTPIHTLTPTSSPTWLSFTPSTVSTTPPPTWTPPSTPTWTPTSTPTLPPTPTNCPSPDGWLAYVVQYGDTLDSIAARYRISSAEIQQTNCLVTPALIPGVMIYLPAAPTQAPAPCGHPYTWIFYIVQPGDTLYHLSQVYGITVVEFQRANCLGASTLLHTGQLLYVPPWAPLITLPATPIVVTPADTLTDTPPSGLPSETPTEPSISTATEPPTAP